MIISDGIIQEIKDIKNRQEPGALEAWLLTTHDAFVMAGNYEELMYIVS